MIPPFDTERHIGTCADCGKRCCPDRVAGPLREGEAYGFGDEVWCFCDDCAAKPTVQTKSSLLIETAPGKMKVVTKLAPETLPLFKGGK